VGRQARVCCRVFSSSESAPFQAESQVNTTLYYTLARPARFARPDDSKDQRRSGALGGPGRPLRGDFFRSVRWLSATPNPQ
jgi:hypothetical protein